jgi:hypothetical protein
VFLGREVPVPRVVKSYLVVVGGIFVPVGSGSLAVNVPGIQGEAAVVAVHVAENVPEVGPVYVGAT